MSLIQIITLLATILTAGWVSAFFVQAIKRVGWASWKKLVLSGVMAAVVGLAAAWISGDVTNFVKIWNHGLTSDQVVTFAVLVFTSAATWYKFHFKDATWAKTLENWPK